MALKDREARNVYAQEWRRNHVETINAYAKRYRAENKEKIQADKKNYYLAHQEKFKAYKKKYAIENKEKIYLYNTQYRLTHKAAHNKWAQISVWRLKIKVLSYYSQGTPKCNSCGETDVKVLQIDHINGNGNAHRRSIGNKSGKAFYSWLVKQNYPKDFQVLCANCNTRKQYIDRNLYCGES